MSMNIAGKSKPIRGNMTPEPDWEFVGNEGGIPVYEETVPNWQYRQTIDSNGKAVYHKHPTTGVEIRPQMEKFQPEDEPYLKRRFQIYDVGNGMTKKNYDYMPAEGELERIKSASVSADDRVLILEQQVKALTESMKKSAQAAVVLPGPVDPPGVGAGNTGFKPEAVPTDEEIEEEFFETVTEGSDSG